MASGSEGSRRPRGPCAWCVSAVKWIPVIFIVTIIVWSYYAYVIQLCSLTVTDNVERVLYLIGYHILFAVFMWAYWQTIFTEIGRVPSKFKMPRAELERLEQAESEEAQRQILERFAQDLPITNRTVTGAIRYCEKCQHVKPDRAHHCSVCGECVLKMDHHCPWVNNCVAFTNYKFFILFLGYALLYCLFIAFTTLSYFISFWKGDLQGIGRFHILFLFFIAVMFAVSLVSLFCYHCYLVLRNRSTLEAFRAPIFRTVADKDGFSLGKYNNFQEVFGDNKKTWFLPIFTSLGDGLVFPVRAQHQPSSYNSMGSTQTSLGDGVTFPQRCVDEDTDTLLGTRQRWVEEAELDSPPFSSHHSALLTASHGTRAQDPASV
ncbi:palmitoyltransferase ZDHHC15-like isoform X4 [Zootermopsis nevadensis]|uniref:palmitoyltransferase ZDHHC15-like isoform X4 n=1 Tax=Zootermopsis nevadensis TaxID=136037 RepID=UPI000B8E84B3|nr:palmitoyltransferase ZDHHC15-like isoform X4 [Zootermopsis nevadensis]